MASVGPNILIGSPDDSTAGPVVGAVFLYNISNDTLTRFVQPDGGGGNFGTSVTRTQNTALIGSPGANLATSDAGAAYLFDAGPASPTFGLAIGAVPARIDSHFGYEFAPRSASTTGALIVGAAEAIGIAGHWGQAVDIYQQDATISLLLCGNLRHARGPMTR